MPDWLLFGVMLALQLFGIYASIIFYQRCRNTIGTVRWVWLILLSIIGGCIGFVSHFLTLLIVPPGPSMYWQPAWTLLSFVIGTSVLFFSFTVAERLGQYGRLAFGLIFATLVSAGNVAMVLTAKMQGGFIIDLRGVILAVFAIGLLSLIGAHGVVRAARLRAGIYAALTLGFAAPVQDVILLASITPTFDPAAPVPSGLSHDQTLMPLVLLLGTVVAIVGGVGLALERVMERDALQRYRALALTDDLTGLMNRAGISEALNAALQHVQDTDRSLALVAIDLDRFKPINDLYGHRTGDQVLCTLGNRLNAVCSRREKVGRVGGDEFLAFKVLPREAEINAGAEGERFAQRLERAITEITEIDGISVGVGASLGVAVSPVHSGDADGLIYCADLALSQAKRGHRRICLYEEDFSAATQRKAQMAVELRNAIEASEFELLYQPQISLRASCPVGFEALIRWNHPERGLIMPGDFIPVAEESYLIAEIGDWVLDRACQAASQWDGDYRVSVNVAPPQLAQPNFVERVEEVLSRHDLAPHRLELELTEASMIIDTEHTRCIFEALKKAGVRIAMDDYGTGYASLSMLKTFPFDKLKLDKSFVRALSYDPASLAIVRSTLVLTRALGIPVVAEGAETQAHIEFLVAEGCEEVQGFYFSEPMPESQVQELIALDHTDRGSRSA